MLNYFRFTDCWLPFLVDSVTAGLIYILSIHSKKKLHFLYGKWTEFIRCTDITSYDEYVRENAHKFRCRSNLVPWLHNRVAVRLLVLCKCCREVMMEGSTDSSESGSQMVFTLFMELLLPYYFLLLFFLEQMWDRVAIGLMILLTIQCLSDLPSCS
jgi:hypothetical protein